MILGVAARAIASGRDPRQKPATGTGDYEGRPRGVCLA